MEKWYVAAKKADFDKWAKEFHISPVTARILRNRDLTEESQIQKFLYGKLEDCYSPWLLKDMDRAVEEILKAVKEGLHIRVIGDYDVDGICSSYILTKGFQMLGAQVDTAIPHRIHDGYGLNEHLIEEAKREGVGMIVTCDNGIAAAPQIAMANSLGMRVIVTDHHEVPYIEENGERKEQLPPALAVVDPKRADDTYPFSGICGGVVALKLIQAITEKTGNPEKHIIPMTTYLSESLGILEPLLLKTVSWVSRIFSALYAAAGLSFFSFSTPPVISSSNTTPLLISLSTFSMIKTSFVRPLESFRSPVIL